MARAGVRSGMNQEEQATMYTINIVQWWIQKIEMFGSYDS